MHRIFGLKGKHKRRDTKAIQKALNAARYGEHTVYIPSGTYYISKALVIYNHTTLILEDDTILQRHSRDALLKMVKIWFLSWISRKWAY